MHGITCLPLSDPVRGNALDFEIIDMEEQNTPCIIQKQISEESLYTLTESNFHTPHKYVSREGFGDSVVFSYTQWTNVQPVDKVCA